MDVAVVRTGSLRRPKIGCVDGPYVAHTYYPFSEYVKKRDLVMRCLNGVSMCPPAQLETVHRHSFEGAGHSGH